MPKIRYITKKFNSASAKVIEQANSIIEEYSAQGFELTLRQLYYQFVARALIPNTMKEYKRLGSIINLGRLCGLVDWNAITDRTRRLMSIPHAEVPSDLVQACVWRFNVDRWANQKWRPEVWIEKEALVGVIEGVCSKLDVPYYACKGYNSQSMQWRASQRFKYYMENGQTPIIFHLGDHDPSGQDMTRDNHDRLKLFMGGLEVRRLALNMDQVEKYNPPPNPSKITDTRTPKYVAQYGENSWELDALEPKVIARLIEKAVNRFRNMSKWNKQERREKKGRAVLSDVVEKLRKGEE